MTTMRAKMKINRVETNQGSANETLHLSAVGKNEAYPADGSDEDNTFANYTPQASLIIQIANPALHGKFVEGDVYYLDFTKVQPAA